MKDIILLVEDSKDDEFIFRKLLKDFNIQNPVKVVRDGNQAIAYLNGEGVYADRNLFPLPAIIFIDLLMPAADGLVVLNWLKAQPDLNDMRIVVLSHFNQGRLLREAFAMGMDPLFKPFNKRHLESLIQRFPKLWILSQAAA